MFDLIKNDPRLSHFFSYTDTAKHAHRFAAFLTYLAGGHEEWVGSSIDHAHSGRFISEEHF
jgi:truncated hemoglobin YjbI